MRKPIAPNMRKEKGELARVSVPICAFNLGMPGAALSSATGVAKYYKKVAITRYAHALITQCSNISQADLGWVIDGGAISGVSVEDAQTAITANPNFLPAILLPSYIKSDDTGTTAPSRFYTNKTYKKYDKRAGQVPFGRQDLVLPTNYDPAKHSEDGAKNRLIEKLQEVKPGFKAKGVGYDSEEILTTGGGNFPWINYNAPGITNPFNVQ
ncbi:hypothetical protein BI308_25985 [Roseofilum reptotaenium AO1-A]|uniref:Uncharacterized protein n=1 Tax=Roseofilum reptotaenium AO1-A TaxID=1925591 RepID=A0A1L9QAF1_9CYAN|nr:hypothetical protein BI308_25985 [Roseofilum reptotaenium AO1-A]